jgi:hypothetical protein
MKKILFIFLLLIFSCTQESVITSEEIDLEGIWWDGEHREVLIVKNNSMFLVNVPDPFLNMGQPSEDDALQEWDIIIEEINGQYTINLAGGFYCLEEFNPINTGNYCDMAWQLDCLSQYFYYRVDDSCD